MGHLTTIVPAYNEPYIGKTVSSLLDNAHGEVEIIVILDGYSPPAQIGKYTFDPIPKDSRVRVIELPENVGLRAATNIGITEASGEYVMKLDAHCAVSEGFDVALTKDCQPNWTVVPRMYNLHAYDWVCETCGKREYQGKSFVCCGNVQKEILWKRRRRMRSDFMLFDSSMKFGYWHEYGKRPEAKGDISDQLCAIGACFLMERDRWREIGGLDERHGGWGQVGVEMACKAWLSGGKQVVNKNAWFAHMFRTGNFKGTGHNGSTFPYPLSGSDVAKAEKHSRNLWLNDKWPKAQHPLSWLVERFAPVPTWDEST